MHGDKYMAVQEENQLKARKPEIGAEVPLLAGQ